ncbi:MAG: hypothetical protein ACP5M0_07190 [Desulfomonilaceae bacterium]
MTDAMSNAKPTQLRLPLWRDDNFLVSLLYVLTGFIVAAMGAQRMWQFWLQLQPYLPFSLPPDIPDRVAGHLPHALTVFVNFTASLAGVVLGISWCLSGFAELLALRHRGAVPGALVEPERVVESMLGAAKHTDRDAADLFFVQESASGAMPRLSRASKDILYRLCWNIFKLLAILIVAKALFMLADHLPQLLRETIHTAWTLRVPSPTPLYSLIGCFIAIDVMMAVALFMDKRIPLHPEVRIIQACGTAHPLFLASLFEESAAVSMSLRAAAQTKWRLIEEGNPPAYGSLIESVYEMDAPRARLAGYPALVLSAFATILGSYGLMTIQFGGTFASVGQFAAEAGLACAVRLLFLVGVVILGGHLARWAEAFLRLTRWASTLCLVVVWEKRAEANEEGPPVASSHKGRENARWALLTFPHCGGDFFSAGPQGLRQFGVAVLRAAVYSESAAPSARRVLVGASPHKELDESIDHIVEAPFSAHFEKCPPDSDVFLRKSE